MQPDPVRPAGPGRVPPESLAALAEGGTAAAGEPILLADRSDGTVVRVGDTVAKAHAAGTDPAALTTRLRVAADPALEGVLLAPVAPVEAVQVDGRSATVWPYGPPVDPDSPARAPWTEAGALLGRLHSVGLAPLRARVGPLPRMRGPLRAAAAVARLRAADPPPPAAARTTVELAWARLPRWCRGEEEPPADRGRALCHGDFHLGQLVRHPGPSGEWHLIDIDDLGVGDPAWDLARPAAWTAAGLLPPAAWEALLAGYRRHRETGADPWPWLDTPARALTVQSAALALERAARERRPLDEDESALVDSCSRIVELSRSVRT
ncbi:phosphotransferase [Streptomyces sp. TR06-5]|uniref:phosphotransferase n=1 Tax=unclassified Streptomyces TaxID=2593676 RepID=UPI0039A33BC5